jgi:hypothetical protein
MARVANPRRWSATDRIVLLRMQQICATWRLDQEILWVLLNFYICLATF